MTDGLLLIHAWPLDARMWDPQLAAFSQGVPTVAPHLPGFGGSGRRGDTMTMAAAAERCLEAVDEAGLDRVIVCGLSIGGYVAFELWRTRPERFAGLVLANTRAVADTDEARARRLELAARLDAEGMGPMIAQPPPLLSSEASEDLWDLVRGIIADQTADAIAAAARGMAERVDSTPDLQGISVPTLVVTSTGDTLIPPEASAPMADAIPEAKLATLEGAGHLSNLEAPEAFNDELERHLERCRLL